MQEDDWIASDRFIEDHLIRAAEAQDETLRANAAAGLPKIDVSAAQGKFLHLLALAIGARRILEIGTLGGYSTVWLARALGPDGRIATLEFDPKHAEVARANIAREGVERAGRSARRRGARSSARSCGPRALARSISPSSTPIRRTTPITSIGRSNFPARAG